MVVDSTDDWGEDDIRDGTPRAETGPTPVGVTTRAFGGRHYANVEK
jgi:hypothetical protein